MTVPPVQSSASSSENPFAPTRSEEIGRLKDIFSGKVGNISLALPAKNSRKFVISQRSESFSFLETDALSRIDSEETSETLEMSDSVREFVIPESGNLTEVNHL